MLSLQKTDIRRLLVYGIVGTLNTAVCYGVYAALVQWAFWHYTPALVADYVFGAVSGFFLHRLTTFNDRQYLRQAFGKYATMIAITFALNWLLLDALVRGSLLGPLSAQAVATAVVTLIGYLLQSRWVFRSHGQPITERGTDIKDDEPPRRMAA